VLAFPPNTADECIVKQLARSHNTIEFALYDPTRKKIVMAPCTDYVVHRLVPPKVRFMHNNMAIRRLTNAKLPEPPPVVATEPEEKKEEEKPKEEGSAPAAGPAEEKLKKDISEQLHVRAIQFILATKCLKTIQKQAEKCPSGKAVVSDVHVILSVAEKQAGPKDAEAAASPYDFDMVYEILYDAVPVDAKYKLV
jgi:hypothetical protein